MRHCLSDELVFSARSRGSQACPQEALTDQNLGTRLLASEQHRLVIRSQTEDRFPYFDKITILMATLPLPDYFRAFENPEQIDPCLSAAEHVLPSSGHVWNISCTCFYLSRCTPDTYESYMLRVSLTNAVQQNVEFIHRIQDKTTIGLMFLIVLVTEVWTQQLSSADFVSQCKRSLVRIDLAAGAVLNKHVAFSAIDQFGRAFEVGNELASRCGYTITYDEWGNIVFRASLLSCYTQIGNDSHFTVTIRIDITPTSSMRAPESYMKQVRCPYVWEAREILCETNYMEVSVRRKIPVIAESVFQDEPEDWSNAFPEAISGLMSIWQVVFHLTSTRKAMLVKDAQSLGYGINTTESRILLRAPYNTTEAQVQRVAGVGFTSVRATIFYKQRWVILLVDTAVACPVDDVKHSEGIITWTVPKNIPPLLIGASTVGNSRTEVGVDLTTLTANELLRRSYVVVDDSKATTVTVPLGAEGGYYKSHVANGEYGVTYHIRPFIENLWEDNRWGVTKYTIIKDIISPFLRRPPIVTNETMKGTQIFNVTIGTFLPDVLLVNLTFERLTLTIDEAVKLGYTVSTRQQPNGNVTFILKVPFNDTNVKKEYIPEYTSVYTLNVTFGFLIVPNRETFTATAIITAIRDAVPPRVNGSCAGNSLTLFVTRGTVAEKWVPYIKNQPVTPEHAQANGYLYSTDKTNFTVSVPVSSKLVNYDEVGPKGIKVTLPLTLKDGPDGPTMYESSISCIYSAPQLITCSPNGTMTVLVMKLSSIPDMELSNLRLREASCRPTAFTETNAVFSFHVNKCGTSRKFIGNTMIYENDVLYFRPGTTVAAFTLQISCTYTVNNTIVSNYGFIENPTPGAQTASATLTLVLRLSKDVTYTAFYGDPEYPVAKYLRDPLYFEVELLQSQDPRLEVFLEHCWATASLERSSLPKWDVVVNSCEYLEAYNTIFHPVNADSRVRFPTHLKRFEVKMFTFMQADKAYLGQIYFHCSVIICNAEALSSDPLCSRSCIPEKQRKGRSVDSGNAEHGFVSSGPLLLGSEARLRSIPPYHWPQ
ncbi:uncharacterized protein LOC128484134 [Spea bombifrons]|uniref:uncharacterized protein LOC128484134 n=1 Tax=Spea bombifrons TaxID=233779 RepID=UPI00234B3338|nr:uncharacterized protein LOC128484134 [Spea bombifrons]